MMRLFITGFVGSIVVGINVVGAQPISSGTSAVDLTATLVDVNTNLGIGHSTATAPSGVVAIKYRINNLGSAPSGAGNIAFYASKTASLTPSSVFLVYANLFDAVPASGSTQDQTSNVNLPSNLPVGPYYIIVVANYDRKVGETNYSNNASNALPITITAATR